MPRKDVPDTQSPRREPEPPFPRQGQDKPGNEAALRPKPRYQAPDYRAAGKLEDKVALITGGDSGIGRAVAVLYAREGADVAITFLPEERRDAQETEAAVRKEGRKALLLEGDLSDREFCEEAVERTVAELGAGNTPTKKTARHPHRGSTMSVTSAARP